MTEREMFEQSFKRPSDFFLLREAERWDIDNELGILDWEGTGLDEDDLKRFRRHYIAKR